MNKGRLAAALVLGIVVSILLLYLTLFNLEPIAKFLANSRFGLAVITLIRLFTILSVLFTGTVGLMTISNQRSTGRLELHQHHLGVPKLFPFGTVSRIPYTAIKRIELIRRFGVEVLLVHSRKGLRFLFAHRFHDHTRFSAFCYSLRLNCQGGASSSGSAPPENSSSSDNRRSTRVKLPI